MLKSPEEIKRAIARIRRIKGQAAALERSIEASTECAALLQQIVAMRGAINGLMAQVVESYLADKFVDFRETSAKEVDAELAEVMKILRTYFK